MSPPAQHRSRARRRRRTDPATAPRGYEPSVGIPYLREEGGECDMRWAALDYRRMCQKPMMRKQIKVQANKYLGIQSVQASG